MMKITAIESLHCNAGWRNFSFLKISTNEGLIGWSEYNESYGSPGLSTVIEKLGQLLIGQDPRPVDRLTANLYAGNFVRAWPHVSSSLLSDNQDRTGYNNERNRLMQRCCQYYRRSLQGYYG